MSNKAFQKCWVNLGMVQVDISEDLIGQTYGELFARLTLTQHLIPLGLYRRCNSSHKLCSFSRLPRL